MIKKLLSEFIGTFTLVVAGTGAIVVNDVSDGARSGFAENDLLASL